jgi:hypothetical protein
LRVAGPQSIIEVWTTSTASQRRAFAFLAVSVIVRRRARGGSAGPSVIRPADLSSSLAGDTVSTLTSSPPGKAVAKDEAAGRVALDPEFGAQRLVANLAGDPDRGGFDRSELDPGEALEPEARGLARPDSAERGRRVEIGHDQQVALRDDRRELLAGAT